MPFTATLGIVASLSMAGVPLLNGFLSKEMFFAEALAKDSHAAMEWLLPAGATLAGALSVAYSLRFIHDTFFNGEPVGLPKTPHEPPFFMRLPVMLLVLLCLAVGLAPALVAGPLLAVAAQAALYGAPGPALPAYQLAVWHGLNGALLMSAIAVVAGVVLYVALQRGLNLHRITRLPGWVVAGGRELFAGLQAGGVSAAHGLVGALQNGRLQRYLLLLVLMALAAGAAPFVLSWGPSAQPAALHLQGLHHWRFAGAAGQRRRTGHGALAQTALGGGAADGRCRAGGLPGVRRPVGTRSGVDTTAGGGGEPGAARCWR